MDFEHNGEKVLASRLGFRITNRFVSGLMGKIFDNPHAVFTDEILQPERQDLDMYVDGVNHIVETQQRVARQYLQDGSIEDACPPLRALLHIMADGEYQRHGCPPSRHAGDVHPRLSVGRRIGIANGCK